MNRRHALALAGGLAMASLAGCVGSDGPSDDQPAANPDTDSPTTDDRGSNGGNGNDGESSDGESSDEEPNDDSTTDPSDDEVLATLVSETNGFAFDLYRELLADHPDENLFSSPVSIAIALAMTYAGAREETREQMRTVLRYQIDDEAVHEAFAELQRRLDERSESDFEPGDDIGERYDEDDDPVPFELSIANSVWGQDGFPFEADFRSTLEEQYGGGLREVDFSTAFEAARAEINDWVADETEGRIDELLPEGSLDQLTRLVLVNAVYFLANWRHPFQEELTAEEPFTAIDGSEHEVAMMQQNRTWQYADVGGLQAVELPYVGEEVSMLVVLPPAGEFESVEEDFDEETLSTIVAELDSRNGTVHLPRFEFESTFELSETLDRLGMVDAFDQQAANFEGIADVDENLFIDGVYHESFVAVDEEGTEAAAATGVVVNLTSGPMNPFEFVADRPFLFAIRDRPTDAVLFFGRVVDPAGWA